MQCLALALSEVQEYARAESLVRSIYAITNSLYGPNHLDTLECKELLGNMLFSHKKFVEAIILQRKCLKIRTDIFGAARSIKTIANIFACSGP